MNSARKPLRLNSDPSGYDKDYSYKDRYSGGGHGRGYSRRSSSPDRDLDRGRDRDGMYSKYNNHRQDSRDYKYGRAKDIRDSDRER